MLIALDWYGLEIKVIILYQMKAKDTLLLNNKITQNPF